MPVSTRGVYCARVGWISRRGSADEANLRDRRRIAGGPRSSPSLTPAGQAAPSFQVDPLWPKPLPNHWLLGSVTGVAVDAQDHIWVVHRGYDSMTARTEIGAATSPKTSEECCVPAPPVLEFDAAGNAAGPLGRTGRQVQVAGLARRHRGRSKGASGSRRPVRRRFPAAAVRPPAAAAEPARPLPRLAARRRAPPPRLPQR